MMTTPAIRGSWTVSEAVKSLWLSAGLDGVLRSEWPASLTNSTAFLEFYLGDAAPTPGDYSHPMPYVVYDQDDAIPISGSSGLTSDTVQQIHDVPMALTVYHHTLDGAIAVAKRIAEVLTVNSLSLSGDSLIRLYRDGDGGGQAAGGGSRGDGQTWFWTLRYRARIDVTYAEG